MRRYFVMIFFLILLVSCGKIPASLPPTLTPTIQPSFPSTPHTPLPPTLAATPSITPSPLPPTSSAVPSATIIPPPQPFTVLYHPDDVLYVGDQVSIEVISPPEMDVNKSTVRIKVDPPDGPQIGMVNFGQWGIQGRFEASLIWGWDTRNANPGVHTLEFYLLPQGYKWTEQVTLLPASDMPADQAQAHWASTQTQCCTVFYITNTASERDLPTLTSLIDAQAQDVTQKMGSNFTQPITITLLPRLLGHGGFTSSEISVSYLDRNYAANSWATVVHHEMVHALDAQLGGDFRPTLFVEGLAVYITGGHYKLEPLMPRAAALLPAYLDMYIGLKPLADDFYTQQHEIGYLEGASLIEYMVNTYGWDAFSKFYRDIHIKQGESQSDAIDAALKAHFSISFAQLEQDYLTALGNEPDTSTWVHDVRFTVTYYDTMRRYQQDLDPSAYFRTAWLLDNKTMRERGIVADYLRHPHTPENLALETLFITASQQEVAGDDATATQTLKSISAVLDAIEKGISEPFSVAGMATDYLSISSTLHQQGYEAQNITISGDTASAQVTTSAGPDLIKLQLKLSGGEWKLSP